MTILRSLQIAKLAVSNGVPHASSSPSALIDLKEHRVRETVMIRKS